MPALLFIHLTWTTYRRMPMIGSSEAAFLSRFLPAEAQRHGAKVIAAGLVQDHVHLVLQLPAHFDLPRIVQGLKGASAHLANKKAEVSKAGLRWAPGYVASSVGRRELGKVIEYVRQQAGRHPDRVIPGWTSGSARALQGDSRSAEPGL
jgi:REP element-mobilizing transposase RayT